MNRRATFPAAASAFPCAPTRLTDRPVGAGPTPRCPDCGSGDLSYRFTDEDTGCSYPVDPGEHYCRPCDAIWLDEDVAVAPVLKSREQIIADGEAAIARIAEVYRETHRVVVRGRG